MHTTIDLLSENRRRSRQQQPFSDREIDRDRPGGIGNGLFVLVETIIDYKLEVLLTGLM